MDEATKVLIKNYFQLLEFKSDDDRAQPLKIPFRSQKTPARSQNRLTREYALQ
ncbi:hypothetical protein [Myxacorys almedinensis]|uniref:hypothetical protein n=1 Tax=Myxacorys almedinensis TaxID=2651157 RepID=UPI0013913B59|nr:hypothetical protein [Myxacorys almedinensis]